MRPSLSCCPVCLTRPAMRQMVNRGAGEILRNSYVHCVTLSTLHFVRRSFGINKKPGIVSRLFHAPSPSAIGCMAIIPCLRADCEIEYSPCGWGRCDKKSMAIRLYNAGAGESKDEIARVLSVTVRSVTSYLNDIEKQLREERKQKIFDMWMACHTQDEIADVNGYTQPQVKSILDTFIDFGSASEIYKSRDFSHDSDFTPPLYNVFPMRLGAVCGQKDTIKRGGRS